MQRPQINAALEAMELAEGLGEDFDGPAAAVGKKRARSETSGGGPAAPQLGSSAAVGGSRALQAVAKVFVTHLSLNYSEPWRKRGQRSSTGTCFAIQLSDQGRRVLLTNAHVVFRATQIRVRRFRDAERYRAKVRTASDSRRSG